jgi:predicted aminopeptidase
MSSVVLGLCKFIACCASCSYLKRNVRGKVQAIRLREMFRHLVKKNIRKESKRREEENITKGQR